MASSIQSSSDRRKLALIIGNDNYQKQQNRLRTSVNNAKDLSNLLKTINFKVNTASNLDKHRMITEIIDFSKTIGDGDLVLIYFSGHGYQVNGQNYLIPIDDDRIETNRDVEDFAINVESTLARFVKRNPSYVTIMVLDCCRPYMLRSAPTTTSMVGGNGLYQMKTPKGAFIQFSCAANQVINNDLFTKHLLRNIAQENVELNEIFQDISNKVYHESNQRQRPLCMNGLQQHQQVYLNGSELSTAKFLSKEPLTAEEQDYYDDCKEYYRLTEQPLIAVADEVLDNKSKISSSSIKIGIDEDCNKFDLRRFLTEFCSKVDLNINDIAVKQIQVGSTILEAEIFNKFEADDKKISLKMIVHKLTDKVKEQFGKLKMFFMFMGPIKSLLKMRKRRAEITLNPQFNRKYSVGCDYWPGPNRDGKDRGNHPYYCPVGWQRWSFYVTDNFDEKFRGWCIGYHGTKFLYGLSILLSGLKPADITAHGAGVYLTPSINYAAHPRYSEIKVIESSSRKKFFKYGKYLQFVLECRVHPRNIIKIASETLGAKNTTIDSNIDNADIEWLVDNHKKSIVDFNDPDSSIICTGLLTRVTDEHPGLLPESQWWYESHLCDRKNCCLLGTSLSSLQKQKQSGGTCKIIFD